MSLISDDNYISRKKPSQPSSGVNSSMATPQQTTVTQVMDKPSPWAAWGGTLRWAGKELMKPVGVVASLTEGVGKSIGRGELAPLGEAFKKSGNVLLGKEENSFSKIWQENLPEHQVAGTVIGTVIDIAADPLNFAGGLGKKGLSLAKTGIEKLAGKSEVVARTQRGLQTAFSTSTGNKAVDMVIDKYKSLGEYRKAQVLEEARNIQKVVATLPKEDVIKVSNYIEKGEKSTPEINALGERLKAAYGNFKAIEKELGIKGAEIENYVPHIRVQQSLKDKIKQFFNAPEWSNSLKGAEKERTILKFISEDGDEIIGTADYLKLKPIITGYKTKTGEIIKNYLPGTKKIVEGYENAAGKVFQAKTAPIEDIASAFQNKFFEENPAIQFANRALQHVKAVTSQEFFNAVKQFAKPEGLEAVSKTGSIKALEGLKFDERVAKQIGNYYQSIQPEELKLIFRTFDNVQNWWKGQVLIAPSYHVRNMVGNVWNNFLAGVIDPSVYKQAGQLQMGLSKDLKVAGMSGDELLKLAEQRGVINQGWYGADIPSAVEKGITGNWKQGVNPFSQQNYAFKANKAVGSAFENNARLAHFIDKLRKGASVDDAVMSVKKYLFDYQDLTTLEKTVFKRIAPFYTWTKKNIPLQLEHLITQPGKYSGMEKVVRAVEDIGMQNSDPANEKYLSQYIKDNTAMRIKYDEKNKTYYYFLLGNWLPSYQAMDFLNQPFYNLMAMLNPFLKGYVDLKSNKSQFFENTLGESEVIEKYPGDTVNFLGFNMPKKTAYVLRNIRVLNELDKLNPGLIFGGKQGEPSLAAKLNLPNIKLPVGGTLTPAQQKYGDLSNQPTGWAKFLNLFTGKLQPYKEDTAQIMYNSDTKNRLDEMKQAIQGAYLKNDIKRVKQLEKQRDKFIEERLNEQKGESNAPKKSSFNFNPFRVNTASASMVPPQTGFTGIAPEGFMENGVVVQANPAYGDTSNPGYVKDTSAGKNIIAGVDISKYATDPYHEQKVNRIYNSIGDLSSVEAIDKHIKAKSPKSPITGKMVAEASQKYGIDPKLLVAIMRQDSQLGTKGLGVKTKNPGNVGNNDRGQRIKYKTWQDGVNGVAKFLFKYKI